MSIPIRTRLYPKQGSSGLIQKLKKQAGGLSESSGLVGKATSALKNTPFGQFTNSVTNSNFLENMANRGVSAVGDRVADRIGDTLGKAGGSLGGIVGGELGSLASDKLSSFLQGALGNTKTDWYAGPAAILSTTNGLTFPVTPTISTSHTVNYDDYDLVHTNYSALAYKSSRVDNISIVGRFPVNTRHEADYLLGVIHFLRSVTKSHYGLDDPSKGVPPPVLMLDAMGPVLYQATPVVLTTFSHTFEEGCDNVVSSSGTYVPTLTTISLTLAPYYDATRTSQDFTLDGFRKGDLLNRGYI